MSALLTKLNRNRLGAPLARMLGLPNPVELARAQGGYEARPFEHKRALLLALPGGYAQATLALALEEAGAAIADPDSTGHPLDIVVIDATGCRTVADCRALFDRLHPQVPAIAHNARVLLTAALPDEAGEAGEAGNPVAAAVARGVEGFSRALGKELGRKGVCVNLAYVARDAVDRLAGCVRFFCGPRATYVSGQAIRVTARVAQPHALPWHKALDGKVALVTGSARGIGMATAERLAQERARVICLDVPSAQEALHATCTRIDAIPLVMDIAAPDAPRRIADFLRDRFGGVDIVVHNAGITRDRTLAKMRQHEWDAVLDINLGAVTAVDALLLAERVVRDEGRIVCLSSISGVAGNAGQTNYALSKAALIGYVAAQAPHLAARGICINAVAPGFIDTAMTDAMPFFMREIGSLLNALQQAGQPRDVAELVTFLSTPGACGISGETIRVCGQGLIGA